MFYVGVAGSPIDLLEGFICPGLVIVYKKCICPGHTVVGARVCHSLSVSDSYSGDTHWYLTEESAGKRPLPLADHEFMRKSQCF